MKRSLRKEIGLNLSNSSISRESQCKETLLQSAICEFFDRVARTCPDMKRMIADPEDKSRKVPARFRLGTIRMLHEKFEAECNARWTVETFRVNIPFNVVRPNANDWGTCLCAACVNPELKLKALAAITRDSSIKWSDDKDYNDIDALIAKINAIPMNVPVVYNEWKIVQVEKVVKSKMTKSRVSRKVTVKEKMRVFKIKLNQSINYVN